MADHPQLFEEAKASGVVACPLCKCEAANGVLGKHIARHLEELALFSISTSNVEEDPPAHLPHMASELNQSSAGSSQDPSEELGLKDKLPGGDRGDLRRYDPRDDDWDDPREPRRDDNRRIAGDRGYLRRYDPRDDDWDDLGEARRDDNRSQARDDRREIVGEPWITQYLPSDGIEWEVITSDIQIYLGPEASVSMVPDPNVRHVVTDESQSY